MSIETEGNHGREVSLHVEIKADVGDSPKKKWAGTSMDLKRFAAQLGENGISTSSVDSLDGEAKEKAIEAIQVLRTHGIWEKTTRGVQEERKLQELFPSKVLSEAEALRDTFRDGGGKLPTPPDDLDMGEESRSWTRYKIAGEHLPQQAALAFAGLVRLDTMPPGRRTQEIYVVGAGFEKPVEKFLKKNPNFPSPLRLPR
jgi:hypothetical protein